MVFPRYTWYCCLLIIAAVLGLLLTPDFSKPTPSMSPPPAQDATTTEQALRRFAQQTIRREAAHRVSQNQDQPPPPPSRDAQDMAVLAWHRAQQEVKRVLLTPSAAQFPMTGLQIHKTDDSTWVVQGYVDSQNSFGALLRQSYHVSVRYHGPSDLASALGATFWTPETLQVGQQVYSYKTAKKS